jgi:chloramphenicol-sensitive protein RarD
MVKKAAPLESLPGLGLETAILFLPALTWLLFSEVAGRGAFLHAGTTSDVLLMGAGPMTTLPLLLFTASVRRIPLSVVGMTQYVSPTLQFLLGVLVYGEPFTRARLIGFAMVWLALLVFAAESMVFYKQRVRGVKPLQA